MSSGCSDGHSGPSDGPSSQLVNTGMMRFQMSPKEDLVAEAGIVGLLHSCNKKDCLLSSFVIPVLLVLYFIPTIFFIYPPQYIDTVSMRAR